MNEVTKKDLDNLRERILYNPQNGNFYRKTDPKSPVLLYNSDRPTLLLRTTIKKKKKDIPAWRAAVFLAQGTYPTRDESVTYKDANKKNLKITNLIVNKKNDDEITIKDLHKMYGLNESTMTKKLKCLNFIARNVAGRTTHYYNKKEVLYLCADLIKRKMERDNIESIDSLIENQKMIYDESKRKNTMIRDFLKTWTTPKPTGWEMTLC
jgi:hypothetical protein